jgi:integrase/recombinase XerD
MKIDRHGQAAIIDKSAYSKIRAAFLEKSHQLLWDIAFYTGERWGAIVQLQVSDVFDELGRPRDTIVYRASTRKDNQTREVLVSDALKLRLASYSVNKGLWLFKGKIEGAHVTYRACHGALKRALDRAGLSGLGISTHSTRRSFITALDRAGISVRVIQQLVGHSSIANTQRYIDVQPEQLKNALNLI